MPKIVELSGRFQHGGFVPLGKEDIVHSRLRHGGAVDLFLVVMGVEVAAYDYVDGGIGGEEVIDAFAEYLGIAQAHLLQ